MLANDQLEGRFNLSAWYAETYGFVKRTRKHLHRYQRRAIQFLYETPFSAIFLDVGLGKTAIVLTLLADLLKEGCADQVLIVAPLRVAVATWPTEFREWKQSAGIEYSLIRAEDEDDEIKRVFESVYRPEYERQRRIGEPPAVAAGYARRKAAPVRQQAKEMMRHAQTLSAAQVHIINIERLEWLVEFWEKRGRETGQTWPYKIVILDESSKFKDYSTKRYKALKKCLSRIERLHELTASPAAESYQHIFAQIFLLDRGRRFGRYITHYLMKYFFGVPRNRPRKWIIRPGAEKKISAKIADITMVLKLKDVKDELPTVDEAVPLKRFITLNEEDMARYRDFEKTMILKLDNMRIEAVNGAALFNKLLQMTSGAVYDEERRVIPIHDQKIEALQELIDELQGEPLLVSYWFKSSLVRLRKAFPHAVVMGKTRVNETKDRWNAGKIDLMFMQPGGAAHGLNLQQGPGHDLAWFDLCWSRETYEQMIGRLARQGQEQLVRNHHLMVRDSADEYVYDALQDKGEGQDRLFEFIRLARKRLYAST